jgi:hypothetical protein
MVAVEGTGSLGHERAHDRHVFPHVSDRFVVRNAEHAFDDELMAAAEAEREAAAPGRIHGRRLLREGVRMPRIGRHDGRAELDARSAQCGKQQQRERIRPEDVRGPSRCEPVLFRANEFVDGFVDRRSRHRRSSSRFSCAAVERG